MKTLVNIITDDNPIPAYLFIKEMYKAGDRIMYISAKDTEDDLEWLATIDGVAAEQIDEIVLKNDIDEFKYERICRAVKKHLKTGIHYCVNLAGGTRYMALAVRQVFEAFDSEFYYVNLEDNTIIKSTYNDSIYDDDDFFYPIKHRMNTAEYLTANNLLNDISKFPHTPTFPFIMAENIFQLYSKRLFSENDKDIIEALRVNYRNRNEGVPIEEIENPSRDNCKPFPNIRKFLSMISMQYKHNRLFSNQIDWITGGWFEEYVYYKVKEILHPDDIQMGVRFARKGVKHDNELDVVFMKNNGLYVIECKTGVATEHLFNEIVYKACALREALLGVSCYSYIFSLKNDKDGSLKRVAQNMGVTFVDYAVITNPEKLQHVLKGMVHNGGRTIS